MPRWSTIAICLTVLMAGGLARADETDVSTIFGGEPPRSLEDLKAMEAKQLEMASKVVPITVGVRVGPAQGSGVIVSKDGIVLTAAHVAQKPGLPVIFFLPDGSRVSGTTLGMNRDIDAGMMKITDEREGGWPHAELAKYDDVKAGQWVLATGHPGGYKPGRKPVLRLGRILRKTASVLVTDCPLIGGDSGGPLFDMEGRVVGINSRIGSPLTANMHVPVSTYSETWDRLKESEMWGRVPQGAPFIGVRGGTEEKQAAVKGALVEVVEIGGPADDAGIQDGDVITHFGDKELANFQALALAVSRTKPGQKISIRVRREDKELKLELKIGARKG